MSAVVEWIVTAVIVWSAAAVALSWGRLPDSWRRGLALLTSAGGVIMLVVALSAHGQREALTTGQFLLGGAYVTGHATASASLKFYVVMAACLLVGTAGLALPDDAARRMERHWVSVAVGLSLAVTALRFSLEKVAAPLSWTHPVGITWLAPVVGAVFLRHAREQARGFRALLGWLLAYALGARVPVALLMVVASIYRLGSHYDLSKVSTVRGWGGRTFTFDPGTLEQVLYIGVLPQLTFWVAYTVIAGLVGAALAAALTWARRRPGMGVVTAGEPAAAGRES